eukprot:TRINITY_DN5914_c0_g1_i2.p1 TRINITY_DN5914_c0_g1~~TRINITY_DN5914_c0_g1_i2.p1  ORF type:complete len:552 (-),score=62.24 TRINITY_DN5914_c0_g1_i2:34-1689(-)
MSKIVVRPRTRADSRPPAPSPLRRMSSFADAKQSVVEFADFAQRFTTPAVLMCGAAHEGDLAKLKELSALPGFDVNAQDYDGRCALHLASEEGHEECVRFLLANGAQANTADRWNRTPLKGAIAYGRSSIVEILRKHGAMLGISIQEQGKLVNAIQDEERLEGVFSVFKEFAIEKPTDGAADDEDVFISTTKLIDFLNTQYGLRPKWVAKLKHELEELDVNGEVSWRAFVKYQRTHKDPAVCKALANDLVIPDWTTFCLEAKRIFDEVAAECKGKGMPGEFAHDSSFDDMGLCVVSVDGQRFTTGTCNKGFPVASCSYPMLYAFCLEQLGLDHLSQFVGREPSGLGHNSFQLNENKKPHNPLNQAGAIMLCSLYHPTLSMTQRYKEAKNSIRSLVGSDDVGFLQGAYLTQKDTGYQFYALANFMKAEVHAVEVNVCDLAMGAATLANNGVCPSTNTRVLQPSTVKSVLQVMYSCGMYDYSGEWACTIGIPAKSGTNGAIYLVVPSRLGLCVWAPPLDEKENSYMGVEFCRRFAQRFKWSLLDVLFSSKRSF